MTTCNYTFDPASHEETTVTEHWACPHAAHETHDRCVFHIPPSEYDDVGVTEDAVVELLIDRLKNETSHGKEFIGAVFDHVDFDYLEIESETQYPIDLRHTTFRSGLTARDTRFEEKVDLRHAELGAIDFSNAVIEDGLSCTGTIFTGDVDFSEALMTGGNIDFTGVTFENSVSFDGAAFYGNSNRIGDNTTFTDAVFEDDASFFQGNFESTSFENATFQGDALFEKATASGSMMFDGVQFCGVADFDEMVFDGDTSFEAGVFAEKADFRGAEFHGGTALLDDDVCFENANFNENASFDHATFGYANFCAVSFTGTVRFDRARFDDDSTFEGAVFHRTADFDEVQFDGDTDYSDVTFHDDTTFRGAEFHGGTNYVNDDAIFTGATFLGDANFRETVFTSANFLDTAFEGNMDFTEAVFSESLHLRASSFGADTYFNFTEARIADGTITQPDEGWIRVDLTKATLGSVNLSAATLPDEREFLDYFRFCDTTFEGFDFSSHTRYLDRNDWELHPFDSGTQAFAFDVEMTPETIEKTYLNAKNNASAQSNIKAAGEFRVKRQEHARDKFFSIMNDSEESMRARFQNGLRAVENLFLGVTCGYGLRLYRITAVFIICPLIAGLLFTFGGNLFATQVGQTTVSQLGTPSGRETFGLNIYYSYITFLTVGYGNIAPVGAGARIVAPSLVYLNVILAGLFLYALIKRSEI